MHLRFESSEGRRVKKQGSAFKSLNFTETLFNYPKKGWLLQGTPV